MASHGVLVIHGPNLNLLGARDPAIYGSATLDDHIDTIRVAAKRRGFDVHPLQSNSEAEIVGAIQGARGTFEGIIINAGAFTHYSWAIHDALHCFDGAIVEVHLSNPGAREQFRHVSVLSGVAHGTISGFGGLGYVLAVEAIGELLSRS